MFNRLERGPSRRNGWNAVLVTRPVNSANLHITTLPRNNSLSLHLTRKKNTPRVDRPRVFRREFYPSRAYLRNIARIWKAVIFWECWLRQRSPVTCEINAINRIFWHATLRRMRSILDDSSFGSRWIKNENSQQKSRWKLKCMGICEVSARMESCYLLGVSTLPAFTCYMRNNVVA